jgi:hypothetical protein
VPKELSIIGFWDSGECEILDGIRANSPTGCGIGRISPNLKKAT